MAGGRLFAMFAISFPKEFFCDALDKYSRAASKSLIYKSRENLELAKF